MSTKQSQKWELYHEAVKLGFTKPYAKLTAVQLREWIKLQKQQNQLTIYKSLSLIASDWEWMGGTHTAKHIKKASKYFDLLRTPIVKSEPSGKSKSEPKSQTTTSSKARSTPC